jgi:hypothetical protein
VTAIQAETNPVPVVATAGVEIDYLAGDEQSTVAGLVHVSHAASARKPMAVQAWAH